MYRKTKRNPFSKDEKFVLEEEQLSRKTKNTAFHCEQCGIDVTPLNNGSFRNHCPHCLYSKQLDIVPGDRANPCKGLMKPITIDYSSKKGYQLVHQCTKCGHQSRNKVAVDCTQEDQLILFMQSI
ncbi:MAG TPA: RNHCP domain-containing protein [Lysinibacillus sp.]|nr:RNHCP domain-containing protein [Lysinibacillus sp.]